MRFLIPWTALTCATVFFISAVGAEEVIKNAIDIAPVIIVRAGDPIVVRYDFSNDSGKPIGYLLGSRFTNVALVDFRLTTNGKVISPLATEEGPPMVKANVRALAPGRFIRHEIELNETYGKLKPGRYKIAVSYSTSTYLESEYGITNLSFERTLLWVEVK